MITMAEALSTARAMIMLMRQRRRRHAIFLTGDEPSIRALSDADEIRESWDKLPNRLVGVYSNGVDPQDVADDIIATAAGDYATRQARALR